MKTLLTFLFLSATLLFSVSSVYAEDSAKAKNEDLSCKCGPGCHCPLPCKCGTGESLETNSEKTSETNAENVKLHQ